MLVEGGVVRAVGSGEASIVAEAGGRNATESVTVTRPASEAWGVELVFQDGSSAAEQAHVQSALSRWQQLVVAPAPLTISPLTLPAGACGKAQSAPITGEVITTLRLYVQFDSLDGRGGAVAAAGPCVVARETGGNGRQRPVIGVVWVDSADLRQGNFADRIWHDILVHEIGHVLGIGTLWHSDALINGRGGSDPRFVGANAVRAFRALGGTGAGIQIETGGGPGTTGSHWTEMVYQTEVMTGWVGNSNHISILTLGAMADFGWTIDYGAADPYTLPAPVAGVRIGTPGPALGERVLQPRYEVSGGRTRALPPR